MSTNELAPQGVEDDHFEEVDEQMQALMAGSSEFEAPDAIQADLFSEEHRTVRLSRPDSVFHDANSHDPDFVITRPEWVLLDN